MSYADEVFKQTALDIINNGVSDEGQIVRPHWEDGTPAHTIKKFGVCNTFDLQKEFPATTVRPVALKSCLDEILWIWQKHSNNVGELHSRIWDSWAISKTKQEIVKVVPRTHEKYNELPKLVPNSLKKDYKQEDIHHSKNCGDYIILEKDNTKRVVQFIDTGTILNTTQSGVSLGSLKDCFVRSVANVGYYGNYKAQDILDYFGKYFNRWVTTWENMIRRGNGIYSGGDWYKDIFVDTDFHCCEFFLRWVMKNNQYKEKEKLGDLQIDKDYYGSNCYSSDTCTLLTPEQNSRLNCKEWYEYKGKIFFGKQDLANEVKNFYRNALKPNGYYNDYAMDKFIELESDNKELKIIPLKNEDGSLNRFPLEPEYTIKKAYGAQFSKKYKFPQGEMTQVDDVLWQIKNTPMSRRMQTSIYNYEDLHDMPLYPCFWGTMWDVDIENGLLNLTVLSRSNDYLVAGMGWNPCQYALLLMMFAQVTGYKPGIMNVYINNCHIYDRHIPIVKELMKRPTYDAPIVKLNPDIKNFYDFTVNDLIVENYQKNPQVKDIPVAI